MSTRQQHGVVTNNEPPDDEKNNHFHDDDPELLPALMKCKADNHIVLQPLLRKLWIACHILELGQETRFAVLVILHRYYANSTTISVSAEKDGLKWKWVGAACLLLGCKMEETPRRIRDVLNVAIMLDFSLHQGSNSTVPILSQPPNLDAEYWKSKEQIVTTEQAVLRVLAFDVNISHPHRLVKILLQSDCTIQHHNLHLLPTAWRRLNDALFWAPALTHSPLELALAAIQLSLDEHENSSHVISNNNHVAIQCGVQETNLQQTIADLRLATTRLQQDSH